MHSAPSRRKTKAGEKPEKPESRGEEFKRKWGEDCPELELPPIDNVEHVVTHLFEVGPSVRGEEITHGDLRNWQSNTGVELSEFEAVALVALSREYLTMLRESTSERATPAPYSREKTDDEKRERARQQRQQIKARKAQGTT